MIHLGDTDVEYHSGFQLYMTTPLANPHYLPETCIKVTLVNFTVTGPGLEEQLLAELVRKERPDLQASKDRLLLSISNDKRQLKVRTPPFPLPPKLAFALLDPVSDPCVIMGAAWKHQVGMSCGIGWLLTGRCRVVLGGQAAQRVYVCDCPWCSGDRDSPSHCVCYSTKGRA